MAAGGFALAAASSAQEPPLTRAVDTQAYMRCVGPMVGFRNVGVRCVVGPDGRLEACRVLSNDRRVLRYRRRFECMAGTVTVTLPDGSPAVGRSVQLNLNASSIFSEEVPQES